MAAVHKYTAPNPGSLDGDVGGMHGTHLLPLKNLNSPSSVIRVSLSLHIGVYLSHARKESGVQKRGSECF